VYSSVSLANRRLDRARQITEAVRTVTEEISQGVRERGIDFGWYDDEVFHIGKGQAQMLDWAGSGSDVLAVNGSGGATLYRNRYEKAVGTLENCDVAHSGACFLTRAVNDGEEEHLTSESVTVKSLKFFISGGAKGDGAAPGKVTVVGEVDLIKPLKENATAPSAAFQTTVAERPYNRNQ
jgi:hypothetical protein